MEFQQNELNEILNIYQQESAEIISSMDAKLLALEKDSKNKDIAMQLFRDAHSLKGSARMLGFDDIQNIAHKVEDVISLIKEEKLAITPAIADSLSDCLDFISELINKTIAQKDEFKSPKTADYIKKLEKMAVVENNTKKPKEIVDKNLQDFFSNFDQIENLIISILSALCTLRNDKESTNALEALKNNTAIFLSLINSSENPEIEKIKTCLVAIISSLERFELSTNKKFTFLDLNDTTTKFIETTCNFIDSNNIERKDYYDIVDKNLENEKNQENQKIDTIKADYGKILSDIENIESPKEVYSAIEAIPKSLDENINTVVELLKEIIALYKEKNIPLPYDVSLALKEALGAININNKESINEIRQKLDMIKTMAKFEFTKTPKKRTFLQEQTQKDIINTISNSEIKTLRVDSIKLDNLVGQIGELIVSKIKTNDQLSLAKKISNDLSEWQKNFVKMDYYIKYFDKKYLSAPIQSENIDYRKFSAYNKQLCSLAELHTKKIALINKEMNYLFKQLQESETKLNTTTAEIETMVKNMRILPLSTIFQLFPRMVHNIARDKNKKIDLIIEGADITADKTIIEEIKIPLIHIIRNAIDHGIELPKARKALGKNETGKIIISANYIDTKVIIDIKDDGRGLDIEKIKQKALEKKLLTKEELSAISDDELTNLVFYPGFSTENFVTELSGRGLGLDIVNNKINQLQGRIDIFSKLNQGTVVRIILPATVATKKVFIIEEQEQLWAIETSVIKTIARINSDEIFEKDSNNYYIYDGNAINVYTLSQILNFKNVPRETNKYTLLIIETDNFAFGIIVEKLISDQEIVHKKLAPPLYKIKNISGITTLANGEACLILNIGDIISTITSTKIGTKIITKNGIVRTKDNFKYKILVVDDSHTTRILQKNILSNHGYNTQTATSAINALEKVDKDKFDLIITDVQMPKMSGFEFIEELRKNSVYTNCPVIVVSSEPKEKHLDDIKKTNINAYIEKNLFKQEELINTIESILSY